MKKIITLYLQRENSKDELCSCIQNFKCFTFADLESRKLSWRGKSEVIAMTKGQTAFEEIYAYGQSIVKSHSDMFPMLIFCSGKSGFKIPCVCILKSERALNRLEGSVFKQFQLVWANWLKM